MDLSVLMSQKEVFPVYRQAVEEGCSNYPLYFKRVLEASDMNLIKEFCKSENPLELFKQAYEVTKLSDSEKSRVQLVYGALKNCFYKNL